MPIDAADLEGIDAEPVPNRQPANQLLADLEDLPNAGQVDRLWADRPETERALMREALRRRGAGLVRNRSFPNGSNVAGLDLDVDRSALFDRDPQSIRTLLADTGLDDPVVSAQIMADAQRLQGAAVARDADVRLRADQAPGPFLAGAAMSGGQTLAALKTLAGGNAEALRGDVADLGEASARRDPSIWADLARGAGGLAADAPLMVAGGPLGRVALGAARGRVPVAIADRLAAGAAGAPLSVRGGINTGADQGVDAGLTQAAIDILGPTIAGRTGVEGAVIGGRGPMSVRQAIAQVPRQALAEGAEESGTELAHVADESLRGNDPGDVGRRLLVSGILGAGAGAAFEAPTVVESAIQQREQARRAQLAADLADMPSAEVQATPPQPADEPTPSTRRLPTLRPMDGGEGMPGGNAPVDRLWEKMQDQAAMVDQARQAPATPMVQNSQVNTQPQEGGSREEEVQGQAQTAPIPLNQPAPLTTGAQDFVASLTPEIRSAIAPDIQHLMANPDPAGDLANLKMSADLAAMRLSRIPKNEAAVEPPVSGASPATSPSSQPAQPTQMPPLEAPPVSRDQNGRAGSTAPSGASPEAGTPAKTGRDKSPKLPIIETAAAADQAVVNLPLNKRGGGSLDQQIDRSLAEERKRKDGERAAMWENTKARRRASREVKERVAALPDEAVRPMAERQGVSIAEARRRLKIEAGIDPGLVARWIDGLPGNQAPKVSQPASQASQPETVNPVEKPQEKMADEPSAAPEDDYTWVRQTASGIKPGKVQRLPADIAEKEIARGDAERYTPTADERASVERRSKATIGKQYSDEPSLPAVQRADMDNAQAGRTPIAAPPSGVDAPKNIKTLVDGLADWLGATVYKPIKMRSGGYYDASSGAIALRRTTDLHVVAHEIGHFLDDRFAVLGPYQSTGGADDAAAETFDDELSKFWDQGSAPDKSLPEHAQKNYKRAEGFAEWLAAFMVNPDVAKAAAPTLHARFEAVVPSEVMAKITEYGDGVRAFYHADPIKSGNIQSISDTGPSLIQQAKEAISGDKSLVGKPLTFGIRDWIKRQTRDDLHPLFKAIRWAGSQTDGGSAKARKAEVLIRLLAAGSDKTNAIADIGMIKYNWIKDGKIQLADGVEGGLEHVLAPLDNRTAKAMQDDLDGVSHWMVANRVIEQEGLAEKDRLAEVKALTDKANEVYQDELDVFNETAGRMLKKAKVAGEKVAGKIVPKVTDARDISSEATDAADEAIANEIDRSAKQVDQRRLAAARSRLGKRGDALDRSIVNILTGVDEASETITADAKRRIVELRRNLEKRHLSRLRAISRNNERQAKIDAQRLARMSGEGGGLESDVTRARKVIARVNADPVMKARYEEFARRYRAQANGVLDYLVDAGRLSSEQRSWIKERNQQYVAMQRIKEVGIDAFNPIAKGKIGVARDVIKRFKGSTLEIGNPLVNLMDSMTRSVIEADRNAALRSVADLLDSSRNMYQGKASELGSVAQKVDEKTDGAVKIYRNGAEEYWKFEEHIGQAIKGISDNSQLPWLLTWPARTLRWGVTRSPDFAIRNRIRDIANRLIIGQVKPKDPAALAKHMLNQIPGIERHDKERRAIVELAGGAFAGYYMRDRKAWNKEILKKTKELSKDRNVIVTGLGGIGKGYLKLVENSEFSGRANEFWGMVQQLKAQGVDEMTAIQEAAVAARDLADFAVAGAFIRKATQVVPFLNATIQGGRSLIHAAQRDPANFAIRWTVFSLLPSLATYLLAASGGDEERKEYEALPTWRRDLYWNIKVGPDTWVAIPKPFEAGVVGTTGERLMQAYWRKSAGDNDAVEKAFDGHAGSVAAAISPVDERTLLLSYAPFIEAMFNKSLFTGRNIVSDREEKLPLSQREGMDRASRLGQALGLGMFDPRKVDHVIRGTFGSLGGIAMKASDIGREDKAGSATALAKTISGLSKGGAGIDQQPVTRFLQNEIEAGRPDGKPTQQVREISSRYWKAVGAERDALAAEMRAYVDGDSTAAQFDRAVSSANAVRKAYDELPNEAKAAYGQANNAALMDAKRLAAYNREINRLRKNGASEEQIKKLMLEAIVK